MRRRSRGTQWRILGQQTLFSPLTPPAWRYRDTDVWDGYPAARERVFDMIDNDRITDVAILTGDIHSSWALDVPRNPWSAAMYDAKTASGREPWRSSRRPSARRRCSRAQAQRDVATMLQPLARHLKFLEGDSRGYVLLDVTPKTLQADWYFVPTVTQRTDQEKRAARFVCERGSSHLVSA